MIGLLFNLVNQVHLQRGALSSVPASPMTDAQLKNQKSKPRPPGAATEANHPRSPLRCCHSVTLGFSSHPFLISRASAFLKHGEALKNSNRRRDTFLINKAELDWSLLLSSFPPAPPLHRLYLISFGLKSCKENEEAEAINHL